MADKSGDEDDGKLDEGIELSVLEEIDEDKVGTGKGSDEVNKKASISRLRELKAIEACLELVVIME